MHNHSQKMPSFRKGETLKADSLQHVVTALRNVLVGGTGCEVKPMRDQVVINVKQGIIPAGGVGGVDWYVADTKAELPNTDIAATALGRAEGQVFVRNPANTGWDSITNLE